MTMSDDADVLIAGGGLSGMSLAAHLHHGGPPGLRILVVDDGSRPLAQRSWACWGHAPGLLDAAVERRFDALRVRTAGAERRLRLDAYTYQVVTGRRLETVVRRLTMSPRAAPGPAGATIFIRGRIESVEDSPRGPARVTVDGRQITASWVMDSVRPDPRDRTPAGWMSFTGWHVATPGDVFPPEPMLMDFRTPQGDGLSFVYVLPRSPREALVEHTCLSATAARTDTPGAEDALDTYLRQVLAAGRYHVTGSECGVLPLSPRRPRRRRSPHVLAIGQVGGLVKASTGYAYGRVQRDSEDVTRSLVRHGHPFALPRPPARLRWLDSALLRVLAHAPSAIEPAFSRLFDEECADPVLRFLDEDSTPAQQARIMCGMACGPFLWALVPVRAWRPSPS